MAHIAQTEFVNCVKAKFPEHFSGTRVLEVGSYNVNGSVRDLFECCYYVGVDVAPGEGVDVVCSGDKYTSDFKFDVVISCEMLEHNPFWEETIINMYSLLKEGGLLIFTCAAPGRPEHGTQRTRDGASPSSQLFGNYYRNLTTADIGRVFVGKNIFTACTEFHRKVPSETCSKYPLMNPPGHDQYVNHDLFFVGLKVCESVFKSGDNVFNFLKTDLVSLYGPEGSLP